jgi:hypothetical protein
MDPINRRIMLRTCLLAAAAAAGAATALPGAVQAVPLALDKAPAAAVPDLLEEAQVVVVNPRQHRRWHRRHRRWNRRHRRWVCWWHRGRRVCGWRRW